MGEIESNLAGRLKFSSKNFDQEKYAKVAKSANLTDLRRIKSMFEVKAKYIGDLSEPDNNFKLMFSHGISTPSIIGSGFLVGQVKWEGRAKDGNTVALKFLSEYFVVYSVGEDLDHEYCKMYFEKLSKFATFPYFRSFVASSSADARLFIPPLPSLNDRMD